MSELAAFGKDVKGLKTTPKLNADGSGVLQMEGSGLHPELRLSKAEVSSVVSAFTPAPTPAPTPQPSSELVIGVDIGGWGGPLLTSLSSGGIKHVRISNPGRAAELAKVGLTPATISLGAGGTIVRRNPETYASEFLEAAKANPECKRLEVLNEPELIGSGREYAAYVALLKACREWIDTLPAAQRPLILASWAPTYGFGKAWAALGGLEFVDEVVVHAYGGSSGQHKGLEGGRELIEQAHNESGKPVAVTEIGWPTDTKAGSTGDSQQWTEAQQAQAITNFIAWARTKPYISTLIYFNAVDYEPNNWYGICRKDLSHKPSFQALAEACEPANPALTT